VPRRAPRIAAIASLVCAGAAAWSIYLIAAPRRGVRLGVGIGVLVLDLVAGAWIARATLLAHMLTHTTTLFGSTLCTLAGIGLFAASIVLIAARDPRPATAGVPGRSA
jgi:hypothetical protein